MLFPTITIAAKMIGYLVAARDGAEVIVDTDDDNMPKADWGFPPFQGTYQTMAEDQGFVRMFTSGLHHKKIWPRGLPLDLINSQFDLIALSEDALRGRYLAGSCRQ